MTVNNGLTAAEVRYFLDRLQDSMPLEECATCDCLLGFVTQLEIDAAEDVSALTTPWQVQREGMHHCLGCDPCPPAELYVEYIKIKKRLKDPNASEQPIGPDYPTL